MENNNRSITRVNKKMKTKIEKVPIFKHIVTPEVFTHLTYRMDPASLNNPGFRAASRTFRTNSAFDVDVALASTAMAGHNEWSTFFDFYRVLECRVNAVFYNLEPAIPVMCAMTFSAQTAYALNGFTRALYENVLTVTNNLGSSSTMSKTLNLSATSFQQYGDAATKYDENFNASVLANPLQPLFFSVGIDTGTGSVLNLGATVRLQMTFLIRYFGRKPLTV